jgi:hypothetical protein
LPSGGALLFIRCIEAFTCEGDSGRRPHPAHSFLAVITSRSYRLLVNRAFNI